jgi:hypothetical protein
MAFGTLFFLVLAWFFFFVYGRRKAADLATAGVV